MMMASLNLQNYLDRINFKGNAEVSSQALYDLHVAHTFNVPFENLDVFFRRPILLDEESLFEKIVGNRRGGYCFEMNGIFSMVLKELGYKVTDLLAKGIMPDGTKTAKTHQVLMVEVEGKKWLVDVGFGNEGISAPLLIQTEEEQHQFTNTYRIVSGENNEYILQNKIDGEYQNMYAFSLEPCFEMDFLMSNHFTSTFPDSFFISMRLITMPTKEGRITLTDKHLKITENGEVTEKSVDDENDFEEYLNKYFNLNYKDIKAKD